ncbi:hypothetical protein IRB23SM22_22240 [Alkalibacterium sp. s-m-22]|uniref:Positive regulator of sigma(E), RseC/MucC n=1 Tax=Alkalibacterium indicireducens TaxID=398758 RepID=A0ABP3KU48_9LACT
MSIEIIRPSRYIHSLGKLKVKVNHNRVVKMKNGETKTVDLGQQQAILQVKHFGTKSNKLTVTDGDSVELGIKKWVYWQPVIIGIVVFISSMLTPQVETLPIFENWPVLLVAGLVGATMGLLAGIPYLFFDSYELYKVHE